MRFNIFRNPFVDTQVAYLMDNFDQAVRNQTEDYWRKTIADEIYYSCPETEHGYACEDCYDIVEFIMTKGKPFGAKIV